MAHLLRNLRERMANPVIPTPDIGSHNPRPPSRTGADARAITARVAQGATIGSVMWFHDDMVAALRGGRTRDGWSGTVGPDGVLTIRLRVMGVTHAWTLTGDRRECPQMPGTWLHEGRWAD
ncbi:hypothetical protein SEA_GRAVAILLIA_79 [Mycobacterium phage Gravaillia]|nr:hypothetical protein SEA_GRAVAILLIA_79 [Mycobacterium phage Gravaillia]